MSHIFISYKSDEYDTALKLRHALRAEFGKDAIWWDRNLQTGGEWNQEIDANLASAGCVVVLWSKLSVQSHWVQQEAAVAKALGILTPAQIDDCTIPAPYAGIQAARLINWQGDEKAAEFAELASRIKDCLKKHPSSRSFRNRIKNNIVKWTLMLLLIGSLAGWGAYKLFLRTNHLEPMPSSTTKTIEQLKAEVERLKQEYADQGRFAKYLSPNERVLFQKAHILSLRGDIEARINNTLDASTNSILDDELRQRSLYLANLIVNIDENQLKPANKIIQHEYGGWAFLMGGSTFDTLPEDIPAKDRINYATNAIKEFDAALQIMDDITRRYRANEPEVAPVYEWMTGDSEDVSRTHHLKAIALAVIARAGGGSTPQKAIDEFSLITSRRYLKHYPAKSNPDLRWAQECLTNPASCYPSARHTTSGISPEELRGALRSGGRVGWSQATSKVGHRTASIFATYAPALQP